MSYPNTTLPKAITLAGSATNGPILAWEWSVLPTWTANPGGYPSGSAIATGAVGDFTDGKASIQNPSVTLDVIGGYCFSLRAQNADGWSAPSYLGDGTSCQAIAYVLTMGGRKVPPESMFRYSDDLNASLLSMLGTTTGNLHVYADGTHGNDANSGLRTSSGTAGSFSFSV
jgi:hypothetical protein